MLDKLLERSISASDTASQTYDRIVNDRQSWGIGFPVEIFSKGDNRWYPGQIIKVCNGGTERIIEVMYNGRTKSLPVVSGDIRALMNNSKKKLRLSSDELSNKVTKMLKDYKPKKKAIEFDAFISYVQQDAQDAAGLLKILLERHGVIAWFDMQQADITVTGMSRGIAKSKVFLIFLTKSYFDRIFTVFELETALELGKPIIVVWEGDERRGGYTDFKIYMDECPDKYKVNVFYREAIKFERRKQLQEAQISVIARKVLKCHPSGRESCECRECRTRCLCSECNIL
jgi:Holliday junction resolvasome RuvABC endonuclease subunit